MSKKSLSSRMSAAALSLTLLAGTGGVGSAFAEADNNAQATLAGTSTSRADVVDEALKRKYKTWTESAPKQAEQIMEKANSLKEGNVYAEWMKPKALYNSRFGGAITYRDVLIENEKAMRGGKMLAAVAVIVPVGSDDVEWFKQTEEGKRVEEVQYEMALTSVESTKANGGLIERVYMVQHPMDEPLNISGKQYDPKNAIVILMGDSFPVVQYTPQAASSMAYAMFNRGTHKTVPSWYPDELKLGDSAISSQNAVASVEDTTSGGDSAGSAEQQDPPHFASLD